MIFGHEVGVVFIVRVIVGIVDAMMRDHAFLWCIIWCSLITILVVRFGSQGVKWNRREATVFFDVVR